MPYTWLLGFAGAVAGAAVLHSSPIRYFYEEQAAIEPATLAYLSGATLQAFDGKETRIKASELWKGRGAVVMAVRRPGCMLCRRQAILLTKMKPEFEARGFRLYAVTHEKQGVDGFKTYFKGDVYYDKKRVFFGPQERWLSYLGMLKMSVMKDIYQAWLMGIDYTVLEGEGRLLGAVYVIGPDDRGILFEHRETVFGEIASKETMLKALNEADKQAPNTQYYPPRPVQYGLKELGIKILLPEVPKNLGEKPGPGNEARTDGSKSLGS